jgi:hypothetical protein
MAKRPVTTDITAGFGSNTQYNANLDAIDTAFDNTLSRDGSAPNTMSADFDLNGNDLLNGGDLNAADIIVAGTSLITQVTAAAASAAAAAVSETNAATSETNAEAAFDSFDDRYLGAKASDPSVDNDGDALLSGALYFNTTVNSMKVYNGSTWGDLSVPTTFLALSDTPSAYTGDGGKFAKVNVGETGLEFVTGSGSEPSDGDKGDVTVSGSGLVWNIDAGVVTATELATNAVTTIKILNDNVTTAKIANNNVTLAKMADIATSSILGRVTAATGDPEVLTGTQATTLLDPFTSVLQGLAPASGGGTANFLRADGTWAAPVTGGPTPEGPIATTSGTSHTFSALSTGLNDVTLILDGVSTNGTDNLNVQLGDGTGGLKISGYENVMCEDGFAVGGGSNGFRITASNTAARKWTGHVNLKRIGTTDRWIVSGLISHADASTGSSHRFGGAVTLTADLDRVVLTTISGTNTFDLGQIELHTQ